MAGSLSPVIAVTGSRPVPVARRSGPSEGRSNHQRSNHGHFEDLPPIRQPDRSERQQRLFQSRKQPQIQNRPRLWPFNPTLMKITTFFPGGSAWLTRLETDEQARLRFFRNLYCFYNHPIMRLSSSNRRRSHALAAYIVELQAHIEQDNQAAEIPGSYDTQPQNRELTIHHAHPIHTATLHKKYHNHTPSKARTLTRQNLALLETGSRASSSESHHAPSIKTTKLFTKRQPSKAFKQDELARSVEHTRLSVKRRPSKAAKEDERGRFEQRRRTQIESEASQLKMLHGSTLGVA